MLKRKLSVCPHLSLGNICLGNIVLFCALIVSQTLAHGAEMGSARLLPDIIPGVGISGPRPWSDATGQRTARVYEDGVFWEDNFEETTTGFSALGGLDASGAIVTIVVLDAETGFLIAEGSTSFDSVPLQGHGWSIGDTVQLELDFPVPAGLDVVVLLAAQVAGWPYMEVSSVVPLFGDVPSPAPAGARVLPALFPGVGIAGPRPWSDAPSRLTSRVYADGTAWPDRFDRPTGGFRVLCALDAIGADIGVEVSHAESGELIAAGRALLESEPAGGHGWALGRVVQVTLDNAVPAGVDVDVRLYADVVGWYYVEVSSVTPLIGAPPPPPQASPRVLPTILPGVAISGPRPWSDAPGQLTTRLSTGEGALQFPDRFEQPTSAIRVLGALDSFGATVLVEILDAESGQLIAEGQAHVESQPAGGEGWAIGREIDVPLDDVVPADTDVILSLSAEVDGWFNMEISSATPQYEPLP